MTKRTFLRPSDHRGWVLLCFAFYLLSQLIRGTTPTQEVLNSIPSTSSSIHFNTQISFPVAPQHAVRFFEFFLRLFQNQWNFDIQTILKLRNFWLAYAVPSLVLFTTSLPSKSPSLPKTNKFLLNSQQFLLFSII